MGDCVQVQFLVPDIFSLCNQPINEDQLQLGRKRQVWFIPLADEHRVCSPLRMRAIPECLRGMFTTRRYTNPRLPLPLPYHLHSCRHKFSSPYHLQTSFFVPFGTAANRVLIRWRCLQVIFVAKLHIVLQTFSVCFNGLYLCFLFSPDSDFKSVACSWCLKLIVVYNMVVYISSYIFGRYCTGILDSE